MALCWLATPGDSRQRGAPVTLADIQRRGWPAVADAIAAYQWGIREIPVLLKPDVLDAETRPHANGSNILIPVTPEMLEAEAEAAEKAAAEKRRRELAQARAQLDEAEGAEAAAAAGLKAARGAVETARAAFEDA